LEEAGKRIELGEAPTAAIEEEWKKLEMMKSIKKRDAEYQYVLLLFLYSSVW
jgi:hypothetical protein